MLSIERVANAGQFNCFSSSTRTGGRSAAINCIGVERRADWQCPRIQQRLPSVDEGLLHSALVMAQAPMVHVVANWCTYRTCSTQAQTVLD